MATTSNAARRRSSAQPSGLPRQPAICGVIPPRRTGALVRRRRHSLQLAGWRGNAAMRSCCEVLLDWEIVITRIIDAPRERVWKALTDPTQVVQWWGPNGFTTTIHEMEVQVGGVWRHTMHRPDGRNYPNKNVFTDIVKPQRLSYSHGWDTKTDTGEMFLATWTFILTGIGWLPGLVAGQGAPASVFYYTAPRITTTIFNLASVALAATMLLSVLMLPRPPGNHPFVRRLGHLSEWMLVPVIALGWSAVPALDAQTRLLLGRPMEFWVTEKTRSPTA